MPAEFERLAAEFERLRHKIEHIDEESPNIGRMRREISAIEARATSADQSVTVVADAAGGVTDIQLTEDALRQRPQALAATLMTTLRAAVADAARQQVTVFGAHLMTEDPALEGAALEGAASDDAGRDANPWSPGDVDALNRGLPQDESWPGSTPPDSRDS